MVTLRGLEPLTFSFVAKRSLQLNYRVIIWLRVRDLHPRSFGYEPNELLLLQPDIIGSPLADTRWKVCIRPSCEQELFHISSHNVRGLTRTNIFEVLAGMEGFEPTIHCTKNSCLTTWLHPNKTMADSEGFEPSVPD